MMKITMCSKIIFLASLLALVSSYTPFSQATTTSTVYEEGAPTTARIHPNNQPQKVLPHELMKFVPVNYAILDSVSGDVNLDTLTDYILVLKKEGEEDTSQRPLLILLRNKDNSLTQVRRNDATVFCIGCGGMMGDPYVGITIKNGYFSVEHYGGSAWRWTRIITYKYSKKDNEWYLHKDGSESFHATEPNKVETSIRTTKDFGKVKFEEFDIYKDT